MTGSVGGAWLGAIWGIGLVLVVRGLPWRRRQTLVRRLEPYLADTAAPSRLLAPTAGDGRRARSAAGRVLAGVGNVLAPRLDRWIGGSASIRSRLDQLGDGTVEQVRLDQLVWGGTALGCVLGVGLLKAALGTPPAAGPLLLLCLVAGLAGVLARDQSLSRQVARRRERMLAEFPTVAELLALSVAAGEGPVGAMERVSRLCSGELGRDLGRTLARVRAGATLVEALELLADRAALPVLRRFVDGLVVAVERGTPMAEVLRAQAVDVREAGRRDLIESAARREVAMMVPVVFLVLPVSVVFALFPGFYGLVLTA